MLKISANQLPREHQYNGIDIFKLLCAFLICALHVDPFYSNFLGLGHLNYWIQNCICRIAVPFYFTTSGFLLFRKMDFSNIDSGRIKSYCFKIFRLLGTWTFLLFVGGSWQLWYLGALVLAVIILSKMIKKGIKNRYIVIVSLLMFLIGLFGDSYYGFIEPLKKYYIPKLIISGYDLIFITTRNGVFFGLIFVLMGALFAKTKIVMNNIIIVIGLFVSTSLLFLEAYLLRHFSHPKDYNMYLSLIPVVFFLFYLATHINLKNRPIYNSLRIIGMSMFFTHLFVDYFVRLSFDILKNKIGINLNALTFVCSLLFTLILSIILERLSRKEKFLWIHYLFS